MALQIPKSREQSFLLFMELPEKDFVMLEKILKESKPTLDFHPIEAQFSASSQVKTENAHDIVSMVISLYGARTSAGKSVAQFVDNLIVAINENPQLKPKDGNSEGIKSRLTRILSLTEGMAISAKALDILHEQHNIYVDSRVLTDLRPVYKDDASELPITAVILYTLKITCHENHEEKEIFVALAEDGINKLKATLDRAIQKGDSLKALFKERKEFPILDAKTWN